ncbi:terminase [[Clostridium] innocuum]|uniref:terminase n=1 Tax=Clostridium innocuum TaxID=1522 RepID=UPI0034AE2404|nr:terminase [Clostridioides difficile]
MTQPMLLLSPKFKDFLRVDTDREFLEGVTACGKTTVGIFKFMCKVAASDIRFHVIAGADLGTVEKNVINGERMLLDQFEKVANYHPSGKGKIRLPHIEYKTNKGIKIVYICGYDNKKRWQKVLGGQVGCVYVDEVNIADMEFLREISHRCVYMMTTSNPDDPSLPVYDEFLNRSRPIKRYRKDYPEELLDMLNQPAEKGWIHWYFNFNDNAALTQEAIERKKKAVAPGTKMYKNKILGLRGRATGLVFPNFGRKKNVISKADAKKFVYRYFSASVDTSYSANSPDTIALLFLGITTCGKVVILDEEVYNNADLNIPLAPSDVVKRLLDFLERNRKAWGFAKNVFVDSADQATLTELYKYKRTHPCIYSFNDRKETTIIDRIHMQQGWIYFGDYLVVDTCVHHIRELEVYSWQEDKYEPEDRNDHTINASQYGWLPFVKYIRTQE